MNKEKELLRQAFKYLKNFSSFYGGHINDKLIQLMVDIEIELVKHEPEPKPDRWSDIKVSFDAEKDALIVGVGESVRLTFDGETGKLKSAEVLR